MREKIKIKQIGIVAACCLVAIALLLFGIRKRMLPLEIAALAGTAGILLIVKKPAWIIYLQIIYCCVNKFLISQFHAPNSINYATDVLMILCFLLALKEAYENSKRTYILVPVLIAALFFIAGTISSFSHHVSPFLLLWSYRNLMRFYLFFFSCAVLLEFDDVNKIFKILSVVFAANILVVSFQFWIQGFNQDNLGGLFGTNMGCNGHMNAFMCVYFSYICVNYMAKKCSIWNFMYVSAGTLYIAALSELKFWFIEYLLILILSILISRFSWRVVLMIAGAVLGMSIGLQLFNAVFPGWEFSLESIIEYAGKGGYSTATDLNRLTALQRISKEFLYHPWERLFGFGLGSCETSAFFNSTFFMQYGTSLHYTYLLHAFTFLETGWVGFILFIGFFVSIFVCVWNFRKKVFVERKTYCLSAGVIAAMCVVQCMYNNALRVENGGYITFFALAIPFICMKGQGSEKDERK